MLATNDIREHMEVIGSDGVHVGRVDRVEGGRIKLTRSDPLVEACTTMSTRTGSSAWTPTSTSTSRAANCWRSGRSPEPAGEHLPGSSEQNGHGHAGHHRSSIGRHAALSVSSRSCHGSSNAGAATSTPKMTCIAVSVPSPR